MKYKGLKLILQDDYEANNMAIGDNLKRLRRDKQWTQDQLATECGIRVGQISKLERNEADPKLKTLYALINALECSPNALLNDVSDTNLDGLLSMVLERMQKLPDENKNVLLDIIDKYCIAVSMQKMLDDKSARFMGFSRLMSSTEEMAKK